VGSGHASGSIGESQHRHGVEAVEHVVGALDHHEHVDRRLGAQARNRGAADVLDSQRGRSEDLDQLRLDGLEPVGPRRVGLGQLQHIGHGTSLPGSTIRPLTYR